MPPAGTTPATDPTRRATAVLAILLVLAVLGIGAVAAVRSFPKGLVALALLVVGVAAALQGARRRGVPRSLLGAVAAVAVLGAVGVLVWAHLLWELGVMALCVLGLAAALRRTFRPVAELEPAEPPRRPALVFNPKSGGGKAERFHLADEAAARGIEAIELRPGDDLVELVRGAVARGADALAAAGGDGTQALVATIAAEHDLPFACIPSGTRNHFALDLGVDRDDVVGALDAFVDGAEKRVDLAELNGRVFVNNVSMGVYASAVQRDAYRDAKAATLLDTVPDVVGSDPGAAAQLRWTAPDGTTRGSSAVLLVSNNPYRLAALVGSGTRPRLDRGTLGIVSTADRDAGGRPLRSWEAPELVVDADRPVPVGVDGEALVMDPPLRFRSRPAALRVRIARAHPGGSPSSGTPTGPVDALRRLLRVAGGAPA